MPKNNSGITKNLEYHKTSCIIAQNFIDVHEKRIVDVSHQLNAARLATIEQNRQPQKIIFLAFL
jgi:hypothetical protein